jgi:DNA-binding MarR family transcriptional regulator
VAVAGVLTHRGDAEPSTRLSYHCCVPQTGDPGDGTDEALAVLRVMATVADSTLAGLTELTLTQFRALRTVVARTPVTMSAVARELAVNPSSVTRACERLIALELLERRQNPRNRRETLLAPTGAGRRVVERVDQDRRKVLAAVLDRLDEADRASVIRAFAAFACAAPGVLDHLAPPDLR